MIVLFGGTLAIVSRQDLFNALSQTSEATRRSPEQTRISREIAVLCLLRRFDTWIQHTVTSPWWRAVLLFPLVLANFVSSGTAVLFFKSLWASANADFRTNGADRALAAGILCFCTCGPLLVYISGVVSSPWWVFFHETVSQSQVLQMPRIPLAVYLYGLLSFAHGMHLILGRSRTSIAASVDQRLTSDITVQRLQNLYLLLLLVCLGTVALVFLVVIPGQLNQMDESLVVSTVFIGILLSVLLAQFLMYSFFMRPAEDTWQPSAFWNLLVRGMGGIFGTVVTLSVLISFTKILTPIMEENLKQPVIPQQLLATPGVEVLVIGLIFVLTFSVGKLIGTAWGTFAIGYIFFSISGVEIAQGETVVEALILLATWINQSTLSADNVQEMLGSTQCTPATLHAVWSVPTFPQYVTLQAR